ncbi:MAG: putative oxidoreductase [Thermoleophilaceae bacterium]|jgi:putative oxidoreductase|nr:putative oxidoreductase [Thermoleophilaceae bacterium]
MFYAGLFKFRTMGTAGFGDSLGAVGVPIPQVFSYLVLALEIFGGLGVVFGLFARGFAFLLMIDMIMAIVLVTSKIGFMSPDGHSGAEVNTMLIGAFLAILLAGPGRLSLDAKLERGRAPAVA